MSAFLALILFADLARGQTPSGYADSSVGDGEFLNNMTATHGTGEVRVVVFAEVGDFLIKSFTFSPLLFRRETLHSIHLLSMCALHRGIRYIDNHHKLCVYEGCI